MHDHDCVEFEDAHQELSHHYSHPQDIVLGLLLPQIISSTPACLQVLDSS